MIFLQNLFHCAWFQGMAMDFKPSGWILCSLSIFLPAIIFQQILERGGFKAVFLPILFAWIVPLLVATIILSAADGLALQRSAYYMMALSGPALPFYAFTSSMEGTVAIYTFFMSGAFTVSIIFYLCVLPLITHRWIRYHRKLKNLTLHD